MSVGEGVAARYRAFVSYSHADELAAGRIHRALELYRIPKRLVGQAGTRGEVPRRLTPVFRDRDELPASDDLSSRIKDALSRSDAMIVICSPAARASSWVAREIAAFRELCPGRPIFAALIDGEPGEAFPEGLSPGDGMGIEPIAADFRKGKDGRRLALLKLVAGLAGLELDALVQRDAQREIRRVTTVTLVALIAVLVMALLLVLAVNARREAERQRSEAEGLVEFMLTDLRTKLKSVGRLDVMAAVNQRAIGYYRDQQALGSLPDDGLDRRARFLHAIGEDDVTRGDLASALARFREAEAVTEATLSRHPNDAKTVFAQAQSEYWIGRVHELNRQWVPAEHYYARYASAAKRLNALEPRNPDYMTEMGYSLTNLGIVALNGTKRPDIAEQFFLSAISWFERAVKARPSDEIALREVGNGYGWLADSFYARSLWGASLGARLRAYKVYLHLYQKSPEDGDRIYTMAIAERAMARDLAILKRKSESSHLMLSSYERSRSLVKLEPRNAQWGLFKAKVECDMLAQPEVFRAIVNLREISDDAAHIRASMLAGSNPRAEEIASCPIRAE